jgi:hypothetical protein
MKTSEVFPSRFLAHDDVDGEVIVTIQRVWLEPMKNNAGKDVQKPCAQLAEFEKPMVVNKTNWLRIASVHGDQSDQWPGRKMVLGVERVQAFGEMVEALRLRAPGKEATQGQQVPVLEFEGEWRATVVHFGKLKGTPLGKLDERALAWFQNDWKPKPWKGAFNGADLKLRAALDASLRDKTSAQPEPELPEPSDDVPF